jgi:flagellar FliL protein
MSKDEKDTAAEAPKSKKKLMMILIAAVLMVGGGVGVYLTMFASKAEAKPAHEAGEVVSLEPITINLAEGHYLKLAFALQATAEAAEKPDGSKALDLAIDQYTGMDTAELSTDKGREAAKKELLEKIEKAYEDEVMDIYFTQFVTQ